MGKLFNSDSQLENDDLKSANLQSHIGLSYISQDHIIIKYVYVAQNKPFSLCFYKYI